MLWPPGPEALPHSLAERCEKASVSQVAWKDLLAVQTPTCMLWRSCLLDPLRHHEQLLFMQVLVMMPPGAVGNTHPVRALQLGEAVACAPRDRSGCHILLICSHDQPHP